MSNLCVEWEHDEVHDTLGDDSDAGGVEDLAGVGQSEEDIGHHDLVLVGRQRLREVSVRHPDLVQELVRQGDVCVVLRPERQPLIVPE